ncbi:ammonia-forming cytochrome c nitrite reductase subunit c552 [Shewanella sp. 125m-1]
MIVNYLIKMLGSISLALLLPAMSVQAADNANAQTTAAKEQQLRDKALRAKFPVQYESWQETSEQTEREDMLASYPAAIILWAGSSFAKEYNSPRGHHFAVADVTHTLRTGIPPEPGSKGLSASCWTCKTPDAPRLMKELGVEGFSAKNFTDVGTEVNSVVYCTDCHVDGKAELAMPRPHAQDAMAKVHLPFDKQDINMQGAQVCGQCHVTYYFQPERSDKVNIPWIFGNNVDDIEKYYDTRRFYEWIHPISKTPILKARHPEFEHWSRSEHAEAGVTCITCHMPEEKDDKGNTFTSHKVSKALDHFDSVCQNCHKSEKTIIKSLENSKATINAKAREVEGLLVKAHYEAAAAWEAGATWPLMNDAIMAIRHSQWRWDFAMASHGLYAHNPQEGNELLDMSIKQVKYARESLAEILKKFAVTKVDYPDISSKETAQAAVGIELDKLTGKKQQFIKQEVDNNWSEVTRYGY